jgi:hypothetical protein
MAGLKAEGRNKCCGTGSGSVLGMRIRSGSRSNTPISSLSKGFCTCVGMIYDLVIYTVPYIKYIFHVKIHLFVTAKFDQDPDSDEST